MLYSFALAAVVSAILSRRVAALPGSFHADHSGPEVLAARQQQQQQQPSCLLPSLIQRASSLTGQEPGSKGIKPGQVAATTDRDNFINFCEGKTLTDGQQLAGGSCNGIPMGSLPSAQNMISAVITNPRPGDRLAAGVGFNITVQTVHLRAGLFANPATNYYTAPQELDLAGDVYGHCHVTIQDIGSMTTTTPPDASKFAFFKGIDDAGNGNGLLTARVDGGLPPGVYRACTMMSATTHQPVVMPVAQRGAQDDCTRFEVMSGGGGGSSSSSSSSSSNHNANGSGSSEGSNNAKTILTSGARSSGNTKANGSGSNEGSSSNGAKIIGTSGARSSSSSSSSNDTNGSGQQ